MHVGTLTKKRECYISSLVVKGMNVKRAIYVSREGAIHVEIVITLVAKEINALQELYAGLMEYVSPVAPTTSHAVKTIPAAMVFCVALIQNAMRAECTISPVVKEMFARNGLSVVQIITAIPAEVMTTPVVKEICAKKIMCVAQMVNASHVEVMNNHAVKRICFFHQFRDPSTFAMNGLSVVQITSVIPAEAMTTPVVKEICARRTMSVDRTGNVAHVAHSSLVREISATRVTIMTIPMGSATNTAI